MGKATQVPSRWLSYTSDKLLVSLVVHLLWACSNRYCCCLLLCTVQPSFFNFSARLCTSFIGRLAK